MYIIVVYDVDVTRVSKVNKFLKMYLHWRQNSVFEGEVSKSQFSEIKQGLTETIDETVDSVMIYKLPSEKNLHLETIGIEKNPKNMIL